jgi:glyoxylase-like metal-dependent hydrolase (beta-lactamase superfamily II)
VTPVQNLVTSGTFSLDGGTWQVDNNVWIVGDDAAAIFEALDGRTLRAIVCTHAHDDHVRAAPALADLTGAPILLHPDDAALWELTHPDRKPDAALAHISRNG